MSNQLNDVGGQWVLSQQTISATGSDTQVQINAGVPPSTSLLTCNTSSFSDFSSNNFTITPAGNAATSSVAPFSLSWSNAFDGNLDYLSFPTNNSFDFGSGSFTIEFWCKRTGTSPLYARYFQTANGDVFTGISIAQNLTTQNQVRVSMSSNGSSWNVYDNLAGTLNDLQWNHCALVRNGSTFTFYVNGVGTLLTTFPGVSIYYNAANTVIIGGQSGTNRSFNGLISNLRVIKGTAVYTSNFTAPTSPFSTTTLLSGTSLLTCNSNTFKDFSTNALAITASGEAAINAESPFPLTSTWSNVFDGSGDYLSIPDNAVFNFGSGSFTVECWVKLVGTGNPERIVNYWNTATTTAASWQIFAASGNSITFQASTNGVTNQVALSKSGLSTNVWYHVAAVRVGDVFALYVNGVLAQSTTQVITLQTANTITVASRRSGGSYVEAFNGYVSNLRAVKGEALYTGNFTPQTTPFATSTVFDASSALTYNKGTDTLVTTVVSASAMSGSLTKLSDGTDFLRAGSNVTLVTGSNGSVTVSASSLASISTYTSASSVATSESTTSSTYVDLATVGPTVTMTTGTSVVCHMFANVAATTGLGGAAISVAVSGATTVAASDSPGANGGGWATVSAAANINYSMAGAVIFTGLTPGVNTFTLKYRVNAITGAFRNRRLVVQRLN
jgi:hypothetical protein